MKSDKITNERLILSALLQKDEFSRAVRPFIKEEYFHDAAEKEVFRCIMNMFLEYNIAPNHADLVVALKNNQNITEKLTQDAINVVDDVFDIIPSQNTEYLTKVAEDFCKDKAMYNAIQESIRIYQGDSKLTTYAIPDILSEAMSVNFDSRIGQEYFDDAKIRFKNYHNPEAKLKFDIEMFNTVTNGGIPRKTLNCFAAPINCFDGREKLEVQYNTKDGWQWCLLSLKQIHFLVHSGVKLFVMTPEKKRVKIETVVKKYEVPCIKVFFKNHSRIVAETHRFMDAFGNEVFAKDAHYIRNDKGTVTEIIRKENAGIRTVYDIMIPHPHWYIDQYGIVHHNTGKTMSLVSLACMYIRQGLNVLYCSNEMSEQEILNRADANLFNKSIEEVKNLSEEEFMSGIDRIKRKSYGKLIVKAFPTGVATANHYRHILDEIKIKKGYTPDVLIVDYLQIMSSARARGDASEYTVFKLVSEELRAVCVEYDMAGWTAAQFNRKGMTSDSPEMTDIANSIGIAASLDGLWGLSRTDELDSVNQLMVTELKTRYGDKSIRKFTIGVNIKVQRLYDIGHSSNYDPTVRKFQTEVKKVSNEPPLRSNKLSKFANFKMDD